MHRLLGTGALLAAYCGVTGCEPNRSAEPVPRVMEAAVPTMDAGMVPAMDAEVANVLKAASMDELFGLSGRELPDTLAGFRLGERPSGEGFRRFVGPDFEGYARTLAGPDGMIRHVVVELSPDAEGIESEGAQLDAMEAQLRAKWGKPTESHGRHRWRSPRAQLFVGAYGGFLRGSPSLIVDLLPAGEQHVCGSHDGFKEFFARFRSALSRKSPTAAAMLDGRDDDMDACTGPPTEWIACVQPVIAKLHKDKAEPFCNLSAEVYWWSTVETTHGGMYFNFARGANGRWKAHGPSALGHDDNLDPDSP